MPANGFCLCNIDLTEKYPIEKMRDVAPKSSVFVVRGYNNFIVGFIYEDTFFITRVPIIYTCTLLRVHS